MPRLVEFTYLAQRYHSWKTLGLRKKTANNKTSSGANTPKSAAQEQRKAQVGLQRTAILEQCPDQDLRTGEGDHRMSTKDGTLDVTSCPVLARAALQMDSWESVYTLGKPPRASGWISCGLCKDASKVSPRSLQFQMQSQSNGLSQ